MASPPARSPYEVLGVPLSASAAEIRAAFRAHCLRLHPDKRGGDSGGVCELSAVRAAFATLSDADRRAAYDASAARDELASFVVFDVVSEQDLRALPRADDGLLEHACRCGGRFALADDEVEAADLVPCDTCSLALRIVR